MKRILIAGAAVLLTVSTVAAAEPCGTVASSSVVAVEKWTIMPVDASYNSMQETLALQLDKPVRMIDGSIVYEDILGEHIASKAIDRDAHLSPGVEYVQAGNWGPHTFERLLEMNPSDVRVFTCVEAVVFADGSTASFAADQPEDELSKIFGQ